METEEQKPKASTIKLGAKIIEIIDTDRADITPKPTRTDWVNALVGYAHQHHINPFEDALQMDAASEIINKLESMPGEFMSLGQVVKENSVALLESKDNIEELDVLRQWKAKVTSLIIEYNENGRKTFGKGKEIELPD